MPNINEECFGRNKSCSCLHNNPLSVNCSGGNLVSIPHFDDEITNKIYSLYFSFNNITEINSTTFQRLTNLRQLMLMNNHITKIDKGSFVGLHKLRQSIVPNLPWSRTISFLG